MNVKSGDNEILLYGTVGEAFFFDGFTARDVVNALAQMKGKDITVRINSGGGIADEGIAIYNALKMHQGKKTVSIDAVAASAASIIAMAGDEVIMRLGSIMMIHEPFMRTQGTADDHAKSVEALDVIAESMADIYASKTKSTRKAMRDVMREETWMTADDAVAGKYADRKDEVASLAVAAFDYRAYQNAPEPIVTLSDKEQWSYKLTSGTAAKPSKEKTEMADNIDVAAVARAKAEADIRAEQEAKAKAEAEMKARIEAETAAARKAEAERCAEINELCSKAGVSVMAATLIRDGSSVEDAKKRIESAKDIRSAVELARKRCPEIDENAADKYIAVGASIAQVRDDLFQKMVAYSGQDTKGQHQPDLNNGKGGDKYGSIESPKLDYNEIYSRRNKERAERTPL
ncbi:MAG: Clp protease ClpP [Anaerolineae bacterium]|nr:Clp protease ClpP [Anaerolineae bacterium]